MNFFLIIIICHSLGHCLEMHYLQTSGQNPYSLPLRIDGYQRIITLEESVARLAVFYGGIHSNTLYLLLQRQYLCISTYF
jgi:hypothetical protein